MSRRDAEIAEGGKRKDFYADPLVYHVLHTGGTRGEVSALERIARRHVAGGAGGGKGAPLRWLEPASGTGRYLHELARRGHSGVGVDLSAGMNRFAREEAARLGVADRVRFVTARMESFAARRGGFDVAVNPINSLRHLMSDAALVKHLGCVGRALREGGVYIAGVELSEEGLAQPTEDVWEGAGRGLRVHQFVSYLPAEGGKRVERVVSHVTVTSGRGKGRVERHFDSVYGLRTYSRVEWERVLAKAGWEVVACYGPTGRAKGLERVGYSLQVLRVRA